MRKIMVVALLLLSATAMAQIKSATLTASGLTCSMCSKAIFKSLSKVPFIKTIDADVEKSTYTIAFKEGEKVELDEVKKAVQNAGFAVADLQVTMSFDNAEVYNDAHVTVDGSTFHFLNVNKQTLQGDKTIRVVDKNYVTPAEHKKYKKFTSMACFETGVMGGCCPGGKGTTKRVYHVTI